MPKQIIIAEQHHIAGVFSEDQIQELVVATGNQQVGDIYLGTVENVIPGIDAAFVNIGDAERNGFIHVSDLGPLRLKKISGAITELLAPQQKVLVQVMKEPTGSKGPRLTGNISLPGRYLVLMPYGKGVNLSRRIKNDNERNRLKALAILIKPSGMGLLVRTEAEGKAEEIIMEDLEFLQRQWETIQLEATSIRPPALLNRDDDFIQRVLRDMYTADVNRIVVDLPDGVKRVKQQLGNWGNGRTPEGVLIDYHQEPQQILDFFRVNAAIKEALKPRVDLPSGGYIIIEPTEALTVIDVNSGSFTHSATSRETVLWTNCEAATEIARQLRLRNIGGVVIVDFIDMDSRRDQLKLLEHFNRVLRADKARPQIAQLSELGLVELTRKRQGKNIYELFGATCPHCSGLGHLAHLPGHHEGETLSIYNQPILVKPAVESLKVETKPAVYDDYSGEDYDELELLNHPSYQEQGSLATRRRRRRRVDLPTGVKEEPATTATSTLEPVSPNRLERKDRGFLARSSRRDESQLEKITVEMTELEQDIYALMGVSPLVHLNQEMKDPRSVMVYVKTTNESTSNGTVSSWESESNEVDDSSDSHFDELFNLTSSGMDDYEEEELDFSPEEEEEEQAIDNTEENISPLSEFESEFSASLVSAPLELEPEPEPESESDPKTEPENGTPLIRRRRIRSSALSK
jgi:ribonuclease E